MNGTLLYCKFMRLSSVTAIGLLFCSTLLGGCGTKKPSFQPPVVVFDSPSAQSSTASVTTSSMRSSEAKAPPASVLIKVPFSPQAPNANWDALHEEACEEMSLIMVRHYLDGVPLSSADAEKEVQAMIAWEHANGYGDDVTIAKLGDIAKALYGSHVRVLENVTADDLRRELAQGHPVIIPAAGRLLGNPYFSGEGPWYHMLVVTGYIENGFITNDPGTKRGEKYLYTKDVLLAAIHDWTGVKEEITQGQKKALVIEK